MCSLCPLPVAKNHNFAQILKFWGLLYRPPFTNEGQIWCAIADPRYTFTCEISSRSVYSVLWRRKTLVFAVFWTSAFSGVANWQQSEKVEHVCTTTNLPLSNVIKIISVLQRLHGEIGRTISDVQKRDEQADKTDRQTNKQKNVFGCPGGGWNLSPTKFGTVIEDLEHVLAPQKLLGVWCTVSVLRGAENLGVNRPPQLKTPHNFITPWENPTKF